MSSSFDAARTAARLWTWSVALAAAGAIFASTWLGENGRWLHYLCKPLATALLLAMVWFASRPVSQRYRFGIALGLAWSIAGDVLLMLPQDRFVAGLVSFLIAHIAYIFAFTDRVRLGERLTTWLACLGLAGVIVWILWPGLSAALHLPVLAYALALVTMAAQAIIRLQVIGSRQGRSSFEARSARFAAFGGMLFIVSDACLAFGRFRSAVPLEPFTIGVTYYLAQWCIARSVNLFGASTVPRAPEALVSQ